MSWTREDQTESKCACKGQTESRCTCKTSDNNAKMLKICYTRSPTPTLMSNGKVRAAFLIGTQWPVGSTVRIGFYKTEFEDDDGEMIDPQYSDVKANWVKKVIDFYITPIVNLQFEWDFPVDDADIRISFIPERGAYSMIGRMSAYGRSPSMNLGWLDGSRKGAVIVHEFGHALGMIHEHSRSDAKFSWNKDKVYNTMGCPPNCWSKRTVNGNVFETFDITSLNGSVYDKDSIMHYYFPKDFFDPPRVLNRNIELSVLDKEWLSKIYPGKPTPPPGPPKPDVNPDNGPNDGPSDPSVDPIDKNENKVNMIVIISLSVLVLAIIFLLVL